MLSSFVVIIAKARPISSNENVCVVIGVGSIRPDCSSRSRRVIRSLPPGHRPVWIALSFMPSPKASRGSCSGAGFSLPFVTEGPWTTYHNFERVLYASL